jgi:hypothetical protein
VFNHSNTPSILRIEHLAPTKDLSSRGNFNTASKDKPLGRRSGDQFAVGLGERQHYGASSMYFGGPTTFSCAVGGTLYRKSGCPN